MSGLRKYANKMPNAPVMDTKVISLRKGSEYVATRTIAKKEKRGPVSVFVMAPSKNGQNSEHTYSLSTNGMDSLLKKQVGTKASLKVYRRLREF